MAEVEILLPCGGKGASILITIRLVKVADIIRSNLSKIVGRGRYWQRGVERIIPKIIFSRYWDSCIWQNYKFQDARSYSRSCSINFRIGVLHYNKRWPAWYWKFHYLKHDSPSIRFAVSLEDWRIKAHDGANSILPNFSTNILQAHDGANSSDRNRNTLKHWHESKVKKVVKSWVS